jgi:hypothetical protein
VASASAGPGATLLITDPGVLEMAGDEVSVTVTASRGENVVLAVGRTADVEAWVGTDAVTRVTGLSDLNRLSTTDVAPSAPDLAETEAPAEGEAAPEEAAPEGEAPAEGEAAPEEAAPDPAGSDLWVAEAVGSDEATLEWPAQDGRWTLLAASTGAGAGPPTVTMTWPQVVTTPYLVPGVAGGAVLLLAGLAWWVVLLRRSRRARLATPTGRVGLPASAQVSPRPAPVGGTTGGAANGTVNGTANGTADPGELPSAPLTRRQIRELEQQRNARPRSSPAEVTAASWHQVVPGPAPAPTSPSHGPTTGPVVDQATEPTTPDAPADRPIERGSATTRWGERIAEHIPHLGRRARPTPEDGSSTPVTSTAGPAQADAVTAGPPTSGTSGTSETSGASGSQGTGHVGAHQHPAAPAPSADAWRRAWGFPAESPPGDQGPAGPSDAPRVGAPEADASRPDEHGRTGTDGTGEGR